VTTPSQSIWIDSGGWLNVSAEWVLAELAMEVTPEAQTDVFVALRLLIADMWPGLPSLVRVHHRWGGVTTVDFDHHLAWVT
jgi:hypothetical protein